MCLRLFVILVLATGALAKVYPPGVSAAVCPDYPRCDPAMLMRFTLDGQPIPEWVYNPSVLPVAPSVHPHHVDLRGFYPPACPNYPYCW